MTELLTEPYIRALQNVAEGNVYRWTLDTTGRPLIRQIWMLASVWPFSQKPYNWLYEHDYIRVANGSQRAELTPAGRAELDNTEGSR